MTKDQTMEDRKTAWKSGTFPTVELEKRRFSLTFLVCVAMLISDLQDQIRIWEAWTVENRKTFGVYILRRRKELRMTQKEFAQKLFVTESAVSKWERGVTYS